MSDNLSISVKNVKKSFLAEDGPKLDVIKGISFNVKHGEIFGIIGESGAGKSTLINIISTLDKADSGQVIIENQNIESFNERELCDFRNKNLGYVFQSFHLLPEFDVLDNILLPARVANKRNLETSYALQLLELVNLTDRRDFSIAKLSGGEKQRVAVARALMNKPKIVFCDEPTGNLDHKNSELMFQLFKDLSDQTNTTFIVVSHSSILQSYTDNLIQLIDGLVKTE